MPHVDSLVHDDADERGYHEQSNAGVGCPRCPISILLLRGKTFVMYEYTGEAIFVTYEYTDRSLFGPELCTFGGIYVPTFNGTDLTPFLALACGKGGSKKVPKTRSKSPTINGGCS